MGLDVQGDFLSPAGGAGWELSRGCWQAPTCSSQHGGRVPRSLRSEHPETLQKPRGF